MSQRPSLATPKEVATFLGKSWGTLQNWRYLGIGPKFVKVGHDVRYRWEDVDEWLAEQAKAAA